MRGEFNGRQGFYGDGLLLGGKYQGKQYQPGRNGVFHSMPLNIG
jgi:hypothetical protein